MAPAGRPKIGKEKRKRVNVMLEPAIHEFLAKAGDGNVSAGIHIVTMGWMAYRAHETLKRSRRPVIKPQLLTAPDRTLRLKRRAD